jgi:prepilin-type N-terminal cleavage/methylation domain-containing protein
MTRRGLKGFTLLEMVIVLTMLALMAAIAGPYLSNGVRAFNDSASAVHTLSKLRVASERLVRELREVRRNPSAPANYDITVGAMPLVFTKTDGETVTVNSAAPLLTLAYNSVAGGSPYALTDQVSSLTFSYLQNDGSSATGSNDVAFVEFELILTHAGNDYRQRTRVALRNQP